MISHIKKYFFVNGIYSLSRALPQAILTPILVGKGLTFSQIALVQIFFTLAQMVGEIPSGIISDKFSRKFTYLLSIGFTCLAYTVVYSQQGVQWMMVAWAIYGLGAATLSSTMDSHFILQIRDDPKSLQRFYAWDRNIILATSVTAAATSSFLYETIGNNLYLVSIILFSISFILGALLLPKTHKEIPHEPRVEEEDTGLLKRLVEEFSIALSSRRILLMLAAVSIIEIAITPLFQFWQMMFIDTGISIQLFGVFFIVSQIFNIVANAVITKISAVQKVTNLCLMLVFLLSLLPLAESRSIVSIAALVLLLLPLYLFMGLMEIELQKNIPATMLSSIRSLGSVLETLVSLLVLGLSSFLLRFIDSGLLIGAWLTIFCILSFMLLRTLHMEDTKSIGNTAT